MSDITAQALEEARNGGNICSFCHGFGTQKQWHAQDFDSDPQGHHVYVKCDHCDGSGVEPTTPQPTTTPPQSEELQTNDQEQTLRANGWSEELSHPDTLRERFDKAFWYDIPNLRLCVKDTPCYDEEENFVGYIQHAAATPDAIKDFIAQEKERWESELRERAGEVLERNELEEFVDFIKSI